MTNLKLMLCESINEVEALKLDQNRFKAQMKFDGERLTIYKKGTDVILVNRSGKCKNDFYKEIETAVQDLKFDFIVDGEICSFDGIFDNLQRRALTQNKEKQEQLRKSIPVVYHLFDVLSFHNADLKQLPLKERLKYVSMFEGIDKVEVAKLGSIAEMLRKAKAESWEGIVIKDLESVYESRRSKSWLKLKLFKTTEIILQSYTTNNAGIRAVDNQENAVQISGQQHIEVKNRIDTIGSCEVVIQYLEKTKDNRFRFPSFVKVKDIKTDLLTEKLETDRWFECDLKK
jgi:ATP-dependent DNA ligase